MGSDTRHPTKPIQTNSTSRYLPFFTEWVVCWLATLIRPLVVVRGVDDGAVRSPMTVRLSPKYRCIHVCFICYINVYKYTCDVRFAVEAPFIIRPCQIGILLSVNSSLTNLGTYSQKHTHRKRKHNYFTTKAMLDRKKISSLYETMVSITYEMTTLRMT